MELEMVLLYGKGKDLPLAEKEASVVSQHWKYLSLHMCIHALTHICLVRMILPLTQRSGFS
jgi:hypothetical protein